METPDFDKKMLALADQHLNAMTEIHRLRNALRPFAEMVDHYDVEDDVVIYQNAGRAITAGDIRSAKSAFGGRGALGKEKDPAPHLDLKACAAELSEMLYAAGKSRSTCCVRNDGTISWQQFTEEYLRQVHAAAIESAARVADNSTKNARGVAIQIRALAHQPAHKEE